MLAQSLRASRQSLARAARQQSATSFRRTFIAPTAIRQADLVQDMYLKELKAYKPTPIKASDAEGSVQKFAIPKLPQSPEESNLANDLQAYQSQVPEVEGQAGSEDGAPVEQDWFEEPEEDEEKAHH